MGKLRTKCCSVCPQHPEVPGKLCGWFFAPFVPAPQPLTLAPALGPPGFEEAGLSEELSQLSMFIPLRMLLVRGSHTHDAILRFIFIL